MPPNYDSQCFTGPPSLSILSESAVLDLLLLKTTSPYFVTLTKYWKQLDYQAKRKSKELLTIKHQNAFWLTLKKLECEYAPNVRKWITNVFDWMFGNNSNEDFDSDRFPMRLVYRMKHYGCQQNNESGFLYEGNEIDTCRSRLCATLGACVYDFPLEAMTASVDVKHSAYLVMLKKSLPLYNATRLLQNAMNKLTVTYSFNETYNDFYYWCENFFSLLSMGRHFSTNGIEVDISGIEYSTACAIMAWLEDLQLTDEISSLTLTFYAPHDKPLFFLPKCSFFHFNSINFKYLHTLSLNVCDRKTLSQLKHCYLRSLSITSACVGKFTLLEYFLGITNTRSHCRRSCECSPSDAQIVGSNLSSSLQCLELSAYLCIIHKFHKYIFPKLVEYVIPDQRYKLDRSSESLVETRHVLRCMDPENRMDNIFLALREQESNFDYETQIKNLRELEIVMNDPITSITTPDINTLKNYCKIPSLNKLDISYSFDMRRTGNELDHLYPYIKYCLKKVSTVSFIKVIVTNRMFRRLSLLENLEELTFVMCDIQAKYNPCRRYFPALRKLSLEIQNVHPSREVMRALFSGGKVQSLHIKFNWAIPCWNMKGWLDSCLVYKELCSLTYLSVDAALLSRPFIDKLRLLPDLQILSVEITDEWLKSNYYYCIYFLKPQTKDYLSYLQYLPSHINVCITIKSIQCIRRYKHQTVEGIEFIGIEGAL